MNKTPTRMTELRVTIGKDSLGTKDARKGDNSVAEHQSPHRL